MSSGSSWQSVIASQDSSPTHLLFTLLATRPATLDESRNAPPPPPPFTVPDTVLYSFSKALTWIYHDRHSTGHITTHAPSMLTAQKIARNFGEGFGCVPALPVSGGADDPPEPPPSEHRRTGVDDDHVACAVFMLPPPAGPSNVSAEMSMTAPDEPGFPGLLKFIQRPKRRGILQRVVLGKAHSDGTYHTSTVRCHYTRHSTFTVERWTNILALTAPRRTLTAVYNAIPLAPAGYNAGGSQDGLEAYLRPSDDGDAFGNHARELGEQFRADEVLRRKAQTLASAERAQSGSSFVSGGFLRQPLNSAAVVDRFKAACDHIALHLETYHHLRITELKMSFRISADNEVYLLWCDEMRVYPASNPHMIAQVTNFGCTLRRFLTPQPVVRALPEAELTVRRSSTDIQSAWTQLVPPGSLKRKLQRTAAPTHVDAMCTICHIKQPAVTMPKASLRFVLLSLSLLDARSHGRTDAGVPLSVALMFPEIDARTFRAQCDTPDQPWLYAFVVLCRDCADYCERSVGVLTKERIAAPGWLHVDQRFLQRPMGGQPSQTLPTPSKNKGMRIDSASAGRRQLATPGLNALRVSDQASMQSLHMPSQSWKPKTPPKTPSPLVLKVSAEPAVAEDGITMSYDEIWGTLAHRRRSAAPSTARPDTFQGSKTSDRRSSTATCDIYDTDGPQWVPVGRGAPNISSSLRETPIAFRVSRAVTPADLSSAARDVESLSDSQRASRKPTATTLSCPTADNTPRM